MTVFDHMPAVWLLSAFVLSVLYFINRQMMLLYGAGACFASLSLAAFSAYIYIQITAFFLYTVTVYALTLFFREKKKEYLYINALALSDIDSDGGYIIYKRSVRFIYPRDPLQYYCKGDVMAAKETLDGQLCAYRM